MSNPCSHFSEKPTDEGLPYPSDPISEMEAFRRSTPKAFDANDNDLQQTVGGQFALLKKEIFDQNQKLDNEQRKELCEAYSYLSQTYYFSEQGREREHETSLSQLAKFEAILTNPDKVQIALRHLRDLVEIDMTHVASSKAAFKAFESERSKGLSPSGSRPGSSSETPQGRSEQGFRDRPRDSQKGKGQAQ